LGRAAPKALAQTAAAAGTPAPAACLLGAVRRGAQVSMRSRGITCGDAFEQAARNLTWSPPWLTSRPGPLAWPSRRQRAPWPAPRRASALPVPRRACMHAPTRAPSGAAANAAPLFSAPTHAILHLRQQCALHTAAPPATNPPTCPNTRPCEGAVRTGPCEGRHRFRRAAQAPTHESARRTPAGGDPDYERVAVASLHVPPGASLAWTSLAF
jgi:hypothetical protein